MTLSLELKLYSSLTYIEHTMSIIDMSYPEFPLSCNKLRCSLDDKTYTTSDIELAYSELMTVYGGLLNGKTVQCRSSNGVEVLISSIASTLDLFRRCLRLIKGEITGVVNDTLNEELHWFKVYCLMDEIHKKWLTKLGFDIFNPYKTLSDMFPKEYALLNPNEKQLLESSVIPTGARFTDKFRCYPLMLTKTLDISNNVVLLQKCCKVYDFMGVAWKYFYGSSRGLMSGVQGTHIVSDINRLVSAYMDYRACVYSILLKD